MSAQPCPPGIVRSSLNGAVGSLDVVRRATTDYWSGALQRNASPLELGLDLMTWWSTVVRRAAPQWASPHTIAREWPIARLRDFSTPNAVDTVATLMLPPQAGHDSCIVDYDAQQSQIATALQAGLTRVYSLDWIGATDATKNANITDYLDVIFEAVTDLGGVVNLVGDCQGGWLAVIYAALYPQTVHTLTIAGAPIDFHAGEPLIHDWLRVLSPDRDMDFYRRIVRANDGVMPGAFLLAGFMTMQPDKEIDRQLQLLANINDSSHVQRYRTFENWFQHTQPIPGAFYLWIVEHLFQNNELIEGTLEIGGRVVDLSQITCPLYLLAGTTDHITPPAQVYALADYAGTARDEIVQREAPGGHLGLFMGHEALRNQWTPLFAEIAERSR